MRKILFVFCLLITFCFIQTEQVSACSCAISSTNNTKILVRDAYKNSQAIFLGKVLELVKNDSSYSFRVKIQVKKIWKGKLSKTIDISTPLDSAACGFSFETGKEYLVYAYENGNKLTTNICSRTKILTGSTEDVAFLNKLKKPISPK